MKTLYAIVSLALLLSLPARAADGTDSLLAALSEIQSLQGNFQQQQFDESNSLVGASAGAYKMLRPGYFLWEIHEPDSQLIVANPDYVWHYDRDLETVTRRPVDDSAQMSPLQILGGNEDLLKSRFSVEEVQPGVFSLSPLAAGAGFQQLQVSLINGQLETLQITDDLNQRIVIALETIESNVSLSPADFLFTPPEGADLFYRDQ